MDAEAATALAGVLPFPCGMAYQVVRCGGDVVPGLYNPPSRLLNPFESVWGARVPLLRRKMGLILDSGQGLAAVQVALQEPGSKLRTFRVY